MSRDTVSAQTTPEFISQERLTADARRQRHLRLAAAAQDAFADPAFQRRLAEIKARCRLARITHPHVQDDTAFDAQHERDGGWALETIRNAFA